ncbi:hypothetical protein D3C81_1435850 [compost metagenome]
MRHCNRLHGLQHRVGNRHSLKQAHTTLQQLTGCFVIALFIQDAAQLHSRQGTDNQVGSAMTFGLCKNFAEKVLRLTDAPLKRQAHAIHAGSQQATTW